MQLTSYEAYALWIGRALAQAEGPVKKADLAAQLDVDEGYVQQVLIFLMEAGLVASKRGNYGGYMLAKDPKKITALALIDNSRGAPAFQIKDGDAKGLNLARTWMRKQMEAVLGKMSILDVPLELRALRRG